MNLEHFPENETAQRMLGSVSNGFYDDSYVGKWLFQVMGTEMEDARRLVEELPYQAFPETATWGLCYHEMKWGLPVRKDLSYEERGRYICQKRDTRVPMNPFTMERIIKSVSGYDVFVDDSRRVNEFIIILRNTDSDAELLVRNLKEIEEKINQVKQSHVAYRLCLTNQKQVQVYTGICRHDTIRVRYKPELDSQVKVNENADIKIGVPTLMQVTVKYGKEV